MVCHDIEPYVMEAAAIKKDSEILSLLQNVLGFHSKLRLVLQASEPVQEIRGRMARPFFCQKPTRCLPPRALRPNHPSFAQQGCVCHKSYGGN